MEPVVYSMNVLADSVFQSGKCCLNISGMKLFNLALSRMFRFSCLHLQIHVKDQKCFVSRTWLQVTRNLGNALDRSALIILTESLQLGRFFENPKRVGSIFDCLLHATSGIHLALSSFLQFISFNVCQLSFWCLKTCLVLCERKTKNRSQGSMMWYTSMQCKNVFEFQELCIVDPYQNKIEEINIAPTLIVLDNW